MFVDDNLYANYRHLLRRMMAASIEALFVILGTPAPLERQCCLAMDKFLKTKCSFERTQLGFLINTRTMMVTLPSDKLTKIRKLTQNWNA